MSGGLRIGKACAHYVGEIRPSRGFECGGFVYEVRDLGGISVTHEVVPHDGGDAFRVEPSERPGDVPSWRRVAS